MPFFVAKLITFKQNEGFINKKAPAKMPRLNPKTEQVFNLDLQQTHLMIFLPF